MENNLLPFLPMLYVAWSDAIIDGTTGQGRGDRFNDCLTGVFLEVVRYLRGVARSRRRRPAAGSPA